MQEPPMSDPALCIELQERVVRALMTKEDWARNVDKYLAHWDEEDANTK